MNVALFGGTFDPIHRGHLAIARAARTRFHLQRIYFVPADVPPHKQAQPIASFDHRYAMVALATAAEPDFVPSLLEAPRRGSNLLAFLTQEERERPVSYSIHTVRRLKRELPRNAKLFFLIGMDAFMEIATWREPEALLEEVEFIVAARPGFSLAEVGEALPPSVRPRAAALKAFRKQLGQRAKLGQRGNARSGAAAQPTRSLVLPGATIHLLSEVQENVSATRIRSAAAAGRGLGQFVAPAVAEYIRKMGLYGSRERLRVAETARGQ